MILLHSETKIVYNFGLSECNRVKMIILKTIVTCKLNECPALYESSALHDEFKITLNMTKPGSQVNMSCFGILKQNYCNVCEILICKLASTVHRVWQT